MAKKTIMVVDDDAADLELIEAILKKRYTIIKVQSGKECLEKLEKIKPDLLLIDFYMPKMSGKELCEKIRDSNLKQLKIVFLTIARFSKSELKELEKMNILDYIQKPFYLKNFVRRIRKRI